MFLWGGKKKATPRPGGAKPALSPEELLLAKSPVADSDIHVMPERYALAAPRHGMSRRTKGIIAAVLAVAIIGCGAVFFSIDWRVVGQPRPVVSPNTPAEQPVDPATALPTEQPTSDNTTPTDTTTPPGTVVAEQPVDGETVDEPTATPPPEQPATPPIKLQLATGKDADRDGLTDVEEVLYGTDRSKPDTDLDGYLDSEELKSGYSPLLVGKKLTDDVSVKTYSGNGFSVIYPALWRVDVPEGSQNQVSFISPTTTDFIEVVVYPRVITSLERWYQEQVAPTAGGSVPKTELLNNWQMMRSTDQLSVYLKSAATNAVYALSYNSGQETELHFVATFAAIIRSLSE